MQKNRWFKFLCSVLSVSVVLTCAPLNKYADSVPETQTYSVIENLHFEVNASITSFWDNYANLEFTISNTGSETIHNWHLTFDLPYSIEGVWGAEVFERSDDGSYTFKNAGWNQDILPGNTISFGMTVSSIDGQPVSILPTFYLLNTTERVVDPSGYSLTYQEYSNWGAGYNGAIILENVSNEVIEDWKLSFETNRNLREVAGAVLETSDNVICFSNDGDNQNLNSGTSWNMTITGGEQNCSDPMTISDIELTTICCAFGLNDDADLNGIPDYADFINGQNQDPDITPTPAVTPSPTPEVDPTATPTPDVTVVPTPESTPTPDPDLDSDGDGVPDVYELEIGTDPNSKDSDNDGIEDGVEVVMCLDPLSEDSDGDGIPDPQEDDDGDGLTLEEELDHGTYPWSEDSDVDGLSDGDEVNSYGSDPMEPDSDGDEIEDGDEIKLGTDPMLPDSDGDGIPDGQERFLQTREEEINNEERPAVTKVEVSLEGTGCLDSVMTIEDVYGRDTYSSDLVGLGGVPVNIEYEGAFEEATITFHYDETLLSANDSNLKEDFLVPAGHVSTPSSLGILYFDEESGLYLDCGATVDETNKTISCTTTHFSTYMVVDKVVWEFYWKSLKYTGELRPSHEGYQGIDYVLEIPCVDTMTEEDIEEMNEISYQIIDHMQDGDRMVVCGYQNYGLGVYPYNMTDDKDVLKRRIDEWPWDNSGHWVGWNGAANETIKTSLGALSIFNVASTERLYWPKEENELVVIAFHNSTDIECTYYSASYRSGTEMTAYIFTLTSGRSTTTQDIWLNHVSGGGVIDCEGKSAADVYAEFAELYELRQGTDSESTNGMKTGDGLWDIYETQGMLSFNGQFYYSQDSELDSDNDGLSDETEMGILITIEVMNSGDLYVNNELVSCNETVLQEPRWLLYGHYVTYGTGKWTVYCVKSDPMIKDTDNDYYSDFKDPSPMKNNMYIFGLEGMFDPTQRDYNYVGIYNHPQDGSPYPSYGGNQDWFGPTGINKDSDDTYIYENGCGLIAFSDVANYLFQHQKRMTFDEYYNYVRDRKSLFGLLATSEGVFYGAICYAIEAYGQVTQQSIHSYPELINTKQPERVLETIVDMIIDNKPVITSVCLAKGNYLPFYEFTTDNDQGYKPFGDLGWHLKQEKQACQHYFTVTGLVADSVSGEVYLRVSNVGRQQYIIFSDYIELIHNHRLMGNVPILNINLSQLLIWGWDLGNLIIVID